jgi:hypothetical protein
MAMVREGLPKVLNKPCSRHAETADQKNGGLLFFFSPVKNQDFPNSSDGKQEESVGRIIVISDPDIFLATSLHGF